MRNPERAAQAIGRLNREEVQPHLQRASQSTAPVQKWVGGLMNEVGPQLHAAREIADIAGNLRRVVLIVDDSEFQLKVLSRILGGRNYEILMAGSGMETLSVLRQRRPDLILMDVQLPDVDGIEITRRLKASICPRNPGRDDHGPEREAGDRRQPRRRRGRLRRQAVRARDAAEEGFEVRGGLRRPARPSACPSGARVSGFVKGTPARGRSRPVASAAV